MGQELDAQAERWAVFVDRVATGTDPADAARLAGYPPELAPELLRLPAVRKALASTIEGRLLSEAAPLALATTLEILKDKSAPASIRGKMAVAVLDRVKDKAPELGQGGGDLADMSRDELARLVGQLQEAGAILIPRDVTPHPPALSVVEGAKA